MSDWSLSYANSNVRAQQRERNNLISARVLLTINGNGCVFWGPGPLFPHPVCLSGCMLDCKPQEVKNLSLWFITVVPVSRIISVM